METQVTIGFADILTVILLADYTIRDGHGFEVPPQIDVFYGQLQTSIKGFDGIKILNNDHCYVTETLCLTVLYVLISNAQADMV